MVYYCVTFPIRVFLTNIRPSKLSTSPQPYCEPFIWLLVIGAVDPVDNLRVDCQWSCILSPVNELVVSVDNSLKMWINELFVTIPVIKYGIYYFEIYYFIVILFTDCKKLC